MASPKPFSTVLLIALFMASLAHARESQFFSKATKETTIANTDQRATLTKQQDQQQVDEPNFIPETTRTGYGLYGHESGQLPPSATTAEGRLPYRTTATTVPQESLYSSYEQNNGNYEQYKNNGETSYFYNKDSYVTDEEKAAPLGKGYTPTSTAALADRSTYYSGGNSLGNVKREGMSDTRFMENGKYFYDIDNEEKYYPNYRSQNSRTTASRSSQYDPNNPNMMAGRYYGNNYKNPSYEYNGNSMEGYGQNQEEFQEVQDEFEP